MRASCSWYVFQKLIGLDLTPGLPTTVLVVTFFWGTTFSIGALGEYVGRIYEEVKGRPRYIIDRKINVSRERVIDKSL